MAAAVPQTLQRLFLLALFVISGLLLTTSKQQNAPVGIILAVLGVMLFWVRRDRIFRGLTVVSLVLLLAAGIGTYLNISKEFVNINQYHAMTRGVLKDSANPETSLKSFGISEQYAILKNNIYYEQYGTVDVNSPILEQDFYSKYGFVSILKYYLTNPDQFSSILDVAAQSAFSIKPAAMGNYEESAGKEFRDQSHFFALYSLLKGTLAPKTFGFILLWMVLVIGLYTPSFITALKARDARGCSGWRCLQPVWRSACPALWSPSSEQAMRISRSMSSCSLWPLTWSRFWPYPV